MGVRRASRPASVKAASSRVPSALACVPSPHQPSVTSRVPLRQSLKRPCEHAVTFSCAAARGSRMRQVRGVRGRRRAGAACSMLAGLQGAEVVLELRRGKGAGHARRLERLCHLLERVRRLAVLADREPRQ